MTNLLIHEMDPHCNCSIMDNMCESNLFGKMKKANMWALQTQWRSISERKEPRKRQVLLISHGPFQLNCLYVWLLEAYINFSWLLHMSQKGFFPRFRSSPSKSFKSLLGPRICFGCKIQRSRLEQSRIRASTQFIFNRFNFFMRCDSFCYW